MCVQGRAVPFERLPLEYSVIQALAEVLVDGVGVRAGDTLDELNCDGGRYEATEKGNFKIVRSSETKNAHQ